MSKQPRKAWLFETKEVKAQFSASAISSLLPGKGSVPETPLSLFPPKPRLAGDQS